MAAPDSVLTVTAAAPSRALCASADVAAEIGAEADAALARALPGLVSAASAAVEAFARRVFARETVEEAWRLPRGGAEVLAPRRAPVAALLSVSEAGVALSAADWEMDPDSGLLWRVRGSQRGAWAREGGRVAVSYQGGFAPIPADVARACALTAAAMWHARGRDGAVRSESAEGVGSVAYLDPVSGGGGLPPLAAELLAPYRRALA